MTRHGRCPRCGSEARGSGPWTGADGVLRTYWICFAVAHQWVTEGEA